MLLASWLMNRTSLRELKNRGVLVLGPSGKTGFEVWEGVQL